MKEMFGHKDVSEYFKDRKHKPKKVVSAHVDRSKWDVVKEYAMFRGCPQMKVEDALICFAVDHAHSEAKRCRNSPDFQAWRDHKAQKKTTKSE